MAVIAVEPEAQVGFRDFSGTLRGEFFGGILWDRRRFEQVLMNWPAYAVLQQLLQGPQLVGLIEGALEDHYDLETELRPAIHGLVAAGLLQTGRSGSDAGAGVPDIRHLPVRDLSLSYLQSPTIVEAELTYGCFRRCRHCAYNSAPDLDVSGDISAEEWGIVCRKLADAGVFVLQMTGGDPFFRKHDIYDILHAADGAGLSLLLRSDTVSASPSRYEEIAALKNLWHLGTSIDGVNAEQHDWIRGQGAFKVLAERVPLLVDAGIRVSCGTTLHKNNFKSVVDIGKMVTSWGASWFDIGFLSALGRAEATMPEYVLDRDEIRWSLATYVEGARAGYYTPLHSHYERRSRGRGDDSFADMESVLSTGLPYMTEWPFGRLRVDPTGCTYTAGKLKGTDFSGGFNLVHQSLEYVWDESPNLKRLRQIGGGSRFHGLDYRALRDMHQVEVEQEATVLLTKKGER